MTKIKGLDGSIRMVPRMSADKLVEEGKAVILERSVLVSEKETRIVKADGSIHQLPTEIAEKFIKEEGARLYETEPVKAVKKETKALEAPAKNKAISKPKKKK